LWRHTCRRRLAWEELQPGKNEYVGGEVYAMVGARLTHNLIAGPTRSTKRVGPVC
jgi:hypothetical protein